MPERLRLASRVLGIPDQLADEVCYLEMAVRPLVERLAAIGAGAPEDRRTGLLASLIRALERLGLAHLGTSFDDGFDPKERLDALVEQLRRGKHSKAVASGDSISRLRQIADLARDFVGSTSGGQRSFEPLLAGTRQIVVGTCVGLGRPSLGLTTTAFDLVIVDEAARCTASELSVPMQAGRWVVLVGDHAQLEPHHPGTVVAQVARETSISQREVARSDFEPMFSSQYGRVAGYTLTKQYRMLPVIGRMVSATFYGGLLEHGRTALEIPEAALPPYLERAVGWLATDELGNHALQKRDVAGTSLSNPTEAALIVALLEKWQGHAPFIVWLEQQKRYSQAIGVICTYASQRDLLRRRVDDSHLRPTLRASIKIDTVDAYQGKENPIVLLSLVRNNHDGVQERGAATISEGFLSRPHRINVAMSRAMDRLIIVGARARWLCTGPMGRLARAFADECDGDGAQELSPSEILPDQAAAESAQRGGKKK